VRRFFHFHSVDIEALSRYSYFFETFENFSSQDDPQALSALKYMLLCKIMLNLVRIISSLPLPFGQAQFSPSQA